MPAQDHLGALTQLPQQKSADERRALWRQGMATLANAALEQQPVPLEGLDPAQLLQAVRIAEADHLLDDLSWLSPPAAAAAIYELAAAIPVGPERRQLGRKAAQWLHEGDAQTFVVLATLLAAESKRALTGVPIRARVALALMLPIGSRVPADRLALALITRPDLRAEWLTEPAHGALPGRRLAARLLERAAREGARRAGQGDSGSLRPFDEPDVRAAFAALLCDREPLVYRHAAVARGVLCQFDPALASEIDSQLDPGLTATQWRRAAVALAASVAHRPDAQQRCEELLDGELPRLDPGLPAAMMFGLATAACAEPEAAEALLARTLRSADLLGAEALVELRREGVGEFGALAAQTLRERLEQWLTTQPEDDDGRVALCEALIDELGAPGEREPSLRDRLDAALHAFASSDPMQALQLAHQVFTGAQAQLSELELTADADRAGRRLGFRALRELDVALLQSSLLGDLLAIGPGLKRPPAQPPLHELFERLGQWLLQAERDPIRQGPIEHLTLRMQRMRALLHLADCGQQAASPAPGSEAGAGEARAGRASRVAFALLDRVKRDAPSPLRRVVCAALARSLDALLREEPCELSDVVVAATDCALRSGDQRVLAEASMHPDLQRCMRAYAELSAATEQAVPSGRSARAALDALGNLAQSLPWASSLRVTALRGCLLRFTQELEATAAVNSLADAAQAEPSPLSRFERSLEALAQLTRSARRRLPGGQPHEVLASAGAIAVLQANIERNVKGEGADLREALTEVHDAIEEELPRGVAAATDLVLDRLRKLPRYRAAGALDSFAPPPPSEPPLPQWLPSRRVLGNFHVVGALSGGALASVFVVTPAGERQRKGAARFALKVPDYDAECARVLSEEQFTEAFRAQGNNLLQLPAHPNLAAIVSFDGEAVPKPMLVMELVLGVSLARVLERRELETCNGPIRWLMGIAEGLCAMHARGIAHLGLRPQTVILRGSASGEQLAVPVLVDFGLAGRSLRMGCGAAAYGAPELWTEPAGGSTQSPLPTDVYAYCALAYEVFTGTRLFQGANERAVIGAHLAHDGSPARLTSLAQEPHHVELCQWLASGLRQHPDQRASMPQLAAGLRELAPALAAVSWPLRAL